MTVTYEQPVPVLYGVGAISDMAQRIANEGKKKAFICCDKGVSASGAADAVAKALDEAGVDSFIYDECVPDAPDTTIGVIAQKMEDYGTDVIIGLGGGSSMDAAKAAGVAYDNGQPVNVFMEENGNPGFEVKTPAYVVPTTAGTGSEVTPMCVIHEMTTDVKKVVLRRAQLAVLDPNLTLSCPASVTVNSGMDALSHAIEAYTSVAPNPKDMIMAINAIGMIAENLPKVIDDPDDIDARGNMLLASNFAGIAFAAMSTHIGHCFAHEVGLRFQLNHGFACGISVPETIRYVAEKKPDEIRDIAIAMDIEIPDEASDREAGEILASGIRTFMRRCGLKSLKEMGVDREKLIASAAGAVDNNWFHIMTPGDVNHEQMAQFMADAYDNY